MVLRATQQHQGAKGEEQNEDDVEELPITCPSRLNLWYQVGSKNVSNGGVLILQAMRLIEVGSWLMERAVMAGFVTSRRGVLGLGR